MAHFYVQISHSMAQLCMQFYTIGNISPAEAEENYYAQIKEFDMVA